MQHPLLINYAKACVKLAYENFEKKIGEDLEGAVSFMIQLKMAELTCMLLTTVGDCLHAPFQTLSPERGKYLSCNQIVTLVIPVCGKKKQGGFQYHLLL